MPTEAKVYYGWIGDYGSLGSCKSCPLQACSCPYEKLVPKSRFMAIGLLGAIGVAAWMSIEGLIPNYISLNMVLLFIQNSQRWKETKRKKIRRKRRESEDENEEEELELKDRNALIYVDSSLLTRASHPFSLISKDHWVFNLEVITAESEVTGNMKQLPKVQPSIQNPSTINNAAPSRVAILSGASGSLPTSIFNTNLL